MPLLLLIRHAVTDSTGKRLTGWMPDVHLSERGREQSDALAERLAPVPVTAIYTSPLERCRETAAPLAKAKGLKVHRSADIGEVHYGDWEGRPLSQLARTKLWRAVQEQPAAVRFPGGETLLEVQDRAVRAASRIAAEHPKATVAMVSHGDVIRLLLAHFAGVHTDLFQRLTVAPASVSAVYIGNRAPHILRVNDTGSLGDLAPHRRKHRG